MPFRMRMSNCAAFETEAVKDMPAMRTKVDQQFIVLLGNLRLCRGLVQFHSSGNGLICEIEVRAISPHSDPLPRICLAWSLRERTERGLQSAGRLGSEGALQFSNPDMQCRRSCWINPAPLSHAWCER